MTVNRTDELISRTLDHQASAEDWAELSQLAEGEPSVWSDLAAAQREHALIQDAIEAAGAMADRIEAPTHAARRHAPRVSRGLGWLGSWSGWLAAAAIALAWVLGSQWVAPGAGVEGAPVRPIASADDALQEYLDRGRAEDRVVRELPRRVLLQSRPMPDGKGYELYYLRQILERTTAPDLYQYTGQDEAGRPALVRYEPPGRSPM